jgi:hypothetical protein
MENRDRDKVSRNNTSPTDAGKVNRETSKDIGNRKDESSSEFGQNIGRSEDLNEPNSRNRSGVGEKGMSGSTGRSSSSDLGSERDSSRSNLGENISGKSDSEH